ncbi:hypothetical protein JOY44_02175 [Phormidium sp. CLA17]|uniref:hypothetical protein n=1 Tax=Leptolyngbya sp. Cla-17 TaxID=2803751 RepID=UPI00149091C5|nr:hypothetical protein [Leptolyngbya sp. Cla-17]MBM0740432.1 hypothetical protein [Leptolyngbya sp. Cla-17]
MNMRFLSVLTIAGLFASIALPAFAVPKAVTRVLPRESFVGTPFHTLPTPPVHPAAFTLPLDIQIVKNDTITTDTPITDKNGIGSDIKVWGAEVQKALYARPKLVRIAGKDAVPFVINGDEGTIVLNANGRAVYAP